MKPFKRQLRTLRQATGMSQKAAAKHSGISQQLWNFYELGKREPTLVNLRRICRGLGVSADLLVGVR